MKRVLVLGAGGFIGGHLAKKLRSEGSYVVGVDIKKNEYGSACNEFIIGDLRRPEICRNIISRMFNEIYQLAADMGGAGFIFSGEHDADILHNSAMINLNVLEAVALYSASTTKIFYSSSACIYPEHNQMDPDNPVCVESTAYPAYPDSEYGWEKLFSERLYLAFAKNKGIKVRIARFHNIFGPEGTWQGGREKAPAAICRKVIEATDHIDVWGDGEQTRSFLYVDECLLGIEKLMASDFTGPVNLGSDEMVTINELAYMAMSMENKRLKINHIPGPLGVRGRCSDNALIQDKLGWRPSTKLIDGLRATYHWIHSQVNS